MINNVRLLESPKQFKSEAERHEWNRKFSEQLDTIDDQRTPEEQGKTRSHLLGWTQYSGTARELEE